MFNLTIHCSQTKKTINYESSTTKQQELESKIVRYSDTKTIKSNIAIDMSDSGNITNNSLPNLIYLSTDLEVQPEYDGGITEFYNEFNKDFHIEVDKNIKGKISLVVIIEKDGSVTDIKVMKDIGYGSDKEALRVIKSLKKWSPGKHNGIIVKTIYPLTIPIEIYAKKQD